MHTVDEAGTRTKLVVCIAAIPTANTVEATERGKDAGADDAMVGPPTHLVTSNLSELMTRYETVAREGGLPIILYYYGSTQR